MNYPFSIKVLGFVHPQLFSDLREYCLSLPLYDRNDTNFDLSRHQGISGIVGKSDTPDVIQRVLDLPELEWAKEATFEDHQVNLFKSGGRVAAHVDQTANGGRVFLRQKVHIPIQGTEKVEYTFVTDDRGTEKFYLQPGRLYVFNDCITHSLVNNGPDDRIQVLMHWKDNMLRARDNLLGVKWPK